MIDKKVFLGMNKDISAKDLRPGEYRHAENLVAITDGVGLSARLENMLGMRETGMPAPINGVCIGMWNYKEGNKIYAFYAGDTSSIIEYDGVLDQGTIILSNNLLDFQIGSFVHDVFFVEGLLYFNDGLHGLRKINIEFAKNNPTFYVDETSLSLIKPPPLKTVTLNKKTDTTKPAIRPAIRTIPLQFATRFVYKDDEISVLSPFSKISPAVDWDINDNHWNYVEVTISLKVTLREQINRVELLLREGNDGNWRLYKKFSTEDFFQDRTVEDSEDGLHYIAFYSVYLDRIGATLSEQETGSSSESVPRLSSAMEFMEDRAFVTSSLEEYNPDEDAWDCQANMVEVVSPESSLNDEIYYPIFFKENCSYALGLVFFDEYGRKTAPVVKELMSFKIPDTFSTYDFFNNVGTDILNGYNHPSAYNVFPSVQGKPPVWAKHYQFALSENLTYNSWVKIRMIAKPIHSDGKTSEPPADLAQMGIYQEATNWYHSVQFHLEAHLTDGTGLHVIPALFGEREGIDLIIPDKLPIPIDEKSKIRLAFDYPVLAGFEAVQRQVEFDIIKIENGRIRISNKLNWIDLQETYYDFAEAIRHEDFLSTGFEQGDKTLNDNEIILHIEVLNLKKTPESPLMYESGAIFDVKDAGTDSRAFQKHDATGIIGGDCYYAAYNNTDKYREEDREDRIQKSISYASMSPIADTSRTGSPINIDAEGNLVETRSNQTGLFWKTAHTDIGRVTVEVPNQKELQRGNQFRWSRTYIQDSLINGLSNFPEENKYALSSDRGDIARLIALNDKILVAICKRSITSIYINKKFISTGETTEFIAQTDSVVGEDRKNLINLGTEHPESVVLHNNNVYGWDSIMSEPWRRGQDGVTPLAAIYGMKTYFETKGEQIRSIRTIDPSAIITVLGGYDPWLEMYILTFSEIKYTSLLGDLITVEAETIGFSERVRRWVSFYSFKPEYYSTIMNNLVSGKDRSLWRHMETVSRNLFYGDFNNSTITIDANKDNDAPKLYQNIGISSTEKWSMTCVMPDGKESLLDVGSFTVRDNIFYADILRNKNTASDTLEVNQTPLLHGEKMIGETLEITLTNDSSNRIVLDAVYIGYSPMVGHLLSLK